ncbi:cold-shock protein [Bradyrhizobium liaoningense]|uniref:cold-shock protein n=1 Tax=Bradyrhizobium liaoningense TaxID=43992 RepID=UPI001BA5DFBF|nr:cold shock domain-containing protein [Bradyrhizobium liaoningense]MBR0907026.1 cold shock domain-containing protein [Bradyrhizobium liaoningense]
MLAGTLKFFDDTRGYGFIAPDDACGDVFVHVKAFKQSRIVPEKGMRLGFEFGPTKDGRPRADRVRRL